MADLVTVKYLAELWGVTTGRVSQVVGDIPAPAADPATGAKLRPLAECQAAWEARPGQGSGGGARPAPTVTAPDGSEVKVTGVFLTGVGLLLGLADRVGRAELVARWAEVDPDAPDRVLSRRVADVCAALERLGVIRRVGSGVEVVDRPGMAALSARFENTKR